MVIAIANVVRSPIDQYISTKLTQSRSATTTKTYQARLLPCDCQPLPMNLLCILFDYHDRILEILSDLDFWIDTSK